MANLSITPSTDQDFTISVSATATDATGNPINVAADLGVDITAAPILPTELNLALPALTGIEDTAIALNLNSAFLNLNNVSEINLSGIPDSVSLSAGTQNSDGTWTVTADQLTNLTLTPSTDQDFTISVSATATDATGNPINVAADLGVDITAITGIAIEDTTLNTETTDTLNLIENTDPIVSTDTLTTDSSITQLPTDTSLSGSASTNSTTINLDTSPETTLSTSTTSSDGTITVGIDQNSTETINLDSTQQTTTDTTQATDTTQTTSSTDQTTSWVDATQTPTEETQTSTTTETTLPSTTTSTTTTSTESTLPPPTESDKNLL